MEVDVDSDSHSCDHGKGEIVLVPEADEIPERFPPIYRKFTPRKLRVSGVGDPEPIKGWRRADFSDIEDIERLVSITGRKMNLLYNRPRLEHLIEKCHFPIIQFDYSGNMVSFTAYEYFPNIPAVPSFCWVEWIRNVYGLQDANPRNALFVHYMVWHPSQASQFLRLVIETAFLEFINVRYVIVVKPPLVDFLLPINIGDSKIDVDSLQLLNVCIRCTLIERLNFRKAIVEDSDRLMSLFKTQTPKFEELYGEFFFAELIEYPGSTDRHIIVCEVNGAPAGFISINLSADLDFLNEEFELLPFHGLKKIVEEDLHTENPSLGTLYLGDGGRTAYDRLNSEELGFINICAPALDKSIVELKRGENSARSLTPVDSDTLTIKMPTSILNVDNLFVSSGSSESSLAFGEIQGMLISDTRTFDEYVARRNQNLLSMAALDTTFFPRYKGPSNAFAIELFAVDNDLIDERASIEFLEAAFAMAPDREYCIITIPTHLLPIPLLTYFVKANKRPVRQIRHELYICHRSSLLFSAVEVKELVESDMDTVKYFMHRVYSSDLILQDFLDSLKEDNSSHGFGLMVGKQVVGVALISHDPSMITLPQHFDVSEYTIMDLHNLESQFILRHLLLDPNFHNYSRFFLMDIMRLADATCLFYVFYDNAKLDISLMSNLGDMRPIRPKKLVDELDLNNYPITELLNFERSFALFVTSSKLCSSLRMEINKIIVVVGASITAVSFFENVIFGTSASLRFTNLIWITRHGTGMEIPVDEIREFMFPIRSKYDRRYRIKLSLKTHIHLIYGIMTGINRAEKYVIVNGSSAIKYDTLVLTLGLQFMTPVPEVKVGKTCQRNKYSRSSLSRFLAPAAELCEGSLEVNPPNMFIINTHMEANNALMAFQFIKDRLSAVTPENKIIVYGHNLKIFTFINAILRLGIPGEMIALVEPFPMGEHSATVFEDDSIDKAVVKSIRQCKINHYREYIMYDWTFGPGNQITTVTFHSRNSQVTLQCLAFIPLVQKLVADVNFNACNDAGLVYDGKLVINGNFKTNDKNIYAAGPFTKYARRYCAPEKAHRYYSSTEIGEKLAEFLLCELYLGASDKVEGNSNNNNNDVEDDGKEFKAEVLPVMKQPLMVYCQLPGEYNYLLVKRPGKPLSLEDAFNYGVCGDVLITGDCDMSHGIGYFRLILDPRGFIMSISCYTKKPIDYKNLCTLYGLHEKLLNNLLDRYDNGMIGDFFEYFDEPWAKALYHSDFRKLKTANLKKFSEIRVPGEGKTFAEKVEEWTSDPPSEKKLLSDYFVYSNLKSKISRNVFDFLTYFESELPLYATPPVLRRLFMSKEKLNCGSWLNETKRNKDKVKEESRRRTEE